MTISPRVADQKYPATREARRRARCRVGRDRATGTVAIGRRAQPPDAIAASDVDLSVDLGRGLVLPNPILVASGTFGYGIEYGDVVDVDRLGGDLLQGHDAQGRGSATRRRG